MKNITTLAQLKKSGYQTKSIKQELRDNLIERLKNKQKTFDGIIGYDTFPSGSISENEAVLLITVKGKNKDAKVVAMLTKLSGNQWRLYQMMNDFK